MNHIPVWTRVVASWHSAALIATSLACYFSAELLFGDVFYLSTARIPITLLAASLFAIGVLLIAAAIGRSKTALRLALATAFVLDMQVAIVLLLFTFQIDNAELLAGIPPFAGPLVSFVAFAIPAAAAVFMLADKPPYALAREGAS